MLTPVKQSPQEVSPIGEIPKNPRKRIKKEAPEGQLRGLKVRRQLDFDSEVVKNYRFKISGGVDVTVYVYD